MSVEKKAESFVKYWNKYLAVNSVLILDYTWPSVSVVDLITFPSRYKKEITEELSDTLHGASAYLAVIAKKCYEESSDKFSFKVSLNLAQDGVEIELEKEEGEKVLVPIEKNLREVLRELPNPFPVTKKFKTPITFEASILSFFAIGIFTASAPNVDWKWLENEDVIAASNKYLANTSAQYYSKFVKKSNLGHSAEFYLNDLIYPPMLMQEPLPLLGSIKKVLEYFHEYKVSKESALEIGRYLAVNPDHLLSNLGLVLTCALSSKIPPAQVLATAKRKGTHVVFLRRAVRLVREFYGQKLDWIESGLKNDQMIKQFVIEKAMKFLPWLTFSKERIEEDIDDYILAPIIIRICEFDFDFAIKLCKEVLEARPDDSEVMIQLIKLELLQGSAIVGDAKEEHSSRVEELVRKLMTAPDVDQKPSYYNSLGEISMLKKDFSKAYTYYKTGAARSTKDLMLLSDMQNNAAWCSMIMNKNALALVHLEQALLTSNCPVTILLNKSKLLWELGDKAGCLEIREKLFNISPYDRRVFSYLKLDKSALEENS